MLIDAAGELHSRSMNDAAGELPDNAISGDMEEREVAGEVANEGLPTTDASPGRAIAAKRKRDGDDSL